MFKSLTPFCKSNASIISNSIQKQTNLYKSRDDRLNSLIDDLEAVSIIQSHDVGTHECEDGHDVVKNLLLKSESKTVTTAFECMCVSVS